MNKYVEWYLDRTWRSIWWWRIFAMIHIVMFWSFVYYLFTNVFPMLDRYSQLLGLLRDYGLI